jgi:GntR family transcriptional repressor for pyruvate dehydrogenase complex
MTVQSQREVALSALRRHLAAAEDEGGRLPPERELASQMKVGRRTIRAALSVLEEEGAISRRQGQGTFFGPPKLVGEREVAELAHRVSPQEIIEARLSIEPALARLAATRASLADIDAMARIAEKARTARNARDYAQADAGFHRKVAECAGNALFRALFEMIIKVREKADWARVRQYYFRHDGARRSYEEHRVIIDAISERDPQAAAAAMQDHLRKVSASLLGADSPLVAEG